MMNSFFHKYLKHKNKLKKKQENTKAKKNVSKQVKRVKMPNVQMSYS